MAKHTITIKSTTPEDKRSSSRILDGNKKTSATNKKESSSVIQKNKPNNLVVSWNWKRGLKFAGGFAAIKVTSQKILTGVNIYTSMNAAATGEELNNNNLLAISNALLNPISFATDLTIQTVLGNLRVARQNKSLEFQRQLTGNLVFSKNFNDGTF